MVKDSLGKLVEKPKYGGVLITAYDRPPQGFDEAYSQRVKSPTIVLTNEPMLRGDWKRGPAGTGEFSFMPSNLINMKSMIGGIVESWEIPDSSTFIFHIRKGIRFHDKPPVNGRELVADDFAFTMGRMYDLSFGYKFQGSTWFKSATATDKYTLVVKGEDIKKEPTAMVFELMTHDWGVQPREMVEKHGDLRDWRNACGTGPFMLTDHVAGASWTLERNPNYWMKDPLHPENQLPYVDTVRFLEIKDKSTRLAGLRTNKIYTQSAYQKISWEDLENLKKTLPHLQYKKMINDQADVIFMRSDNPETNPLADVRVRRALAMAMDNKEVKEAYFGGNAEIVGYPVSPEFPEIYTPLEELPESIRELYEYHPDKAKQLLAEAGYPDGFKTNIVCWDGYVDILSVYKDYWSKIGVDLDIRVKEYGVYQSIIKGQKHDQMTMRLRTISPWSGWTRDFSPGMTQNNAIIEPPYLLERAAKWWSWELTEDQPGRVQLVKEAALYYMEQAWTASTPPLAYVYHVWQPWVKNCYGAVSVGGKARMNYMQYLWLDLDIKEEITGTR